MSFHWAKKQVNNPTVYVAMVTVRGLSKGSMTLVRAINDSRIIKKFKVVAMIASLPGRGCETIVLDRAVKGSSDEDKLGCKAKNLRT